MRCYQQPGHPSRTPEGPIGPVHCCADSYYAVIGSSVAAVEAAGRSPPPFAELVLLTHAEPLLRPLYLLAGMWEPHFSTCTQIRHSSDVPEPVLASSRRAAPKLQ
ncbi:hypothetical protein Shyhy01_21230 [Streptomyces hygroscopicus subsp. hygroscopicus]|nr:hypothetical protein Shyhy01_21230 [Streptomyces hygroscopicus subsp. hygroscopicus]